MVQNHKYIDKKMVNGKWQYTYPEDVRGNSGPQGVVRDPDTGSAVSANPAGSKKKNPVAPPTRVGALKNRVKVLANKLKRRASAAKKKYKQAVRSGSEAAKKKAKALYEKTIGKYKRARQLRKTLDSELKAKADRRMDFDMYSENKKRLMGATENLSSGRYLIIPRQKTKGNTYRRSNLK